MFRRSTRNAGWLVWGRPLPGPRTPESGLRRFPRLGGIDVIPGLVKGAFDFGISFGCFDVNPTSLQGCFNGFRKVISMIIR